MNIFLKQKFFTCKPKMWIRNSFRRVVAIPKHIQRYSEYRKSNSSHFPRTQFLGFRASHHPTARRIHKMQRCLNFIRHMSRIIYENAYLIRAALERIYQKRIHIRFSISHRQPAVSRMSPIRSILYSSLPAYARRHDTEECQINTGWNISAVGFCDPGIFVPFEGWIFGCFLCCSVIFSRGPAVCCTGGTPIMFWNPVRIFLL